MENLFPLGDAHHQPGVGLDEMGAGLLPLLDEALQPGSLLRVVTISGQLAPGLSPALDPPGQIHLLLDRQQGHVAHLPKVQTDRIISGDAAQVGGIDTRCLPHGLPLHLVAELFGILLGIADLDAPVIEEGNQVIQLIQVVLCLGEGLQYRAEGKIPLLTGLVQQPCDPIRPLLQGGILHVSFLTTFQLALFTYLAVACAWGCHRSRISRPYA